MTLLLVAILLGVAEVCWMLLTLVYVYFKLPDSPGIRLLYRFVFVLLAVASIFGQFFVLFKVASMFPDTTKGERELYLGIILAFDWFGLISVVYFKIKNGER